MTDTALHDVWTEGEAYERYVGRWSHPVGEQFLEALAVPPGAAWLDIGCGTGALTRCILEHHAPRQVVGIDCDGVPRGGVVDCEALGL